MSARITSILIGGFLAAGCQTVLGDFIVGDAGAGVDDGEAAVDSNDTSTADASEAATPHDATVTDARAESDAGAESGSDAGAGVDVGTGDVADAGSDAGGGGDAMDSGPWTPAVLDQAGILALWLEASAANLVISNGAVGTWKDLSRNKNDAANAQAGPLPQGAVINGHDAVRFNTYGVALDIADAPSLQMAADQIYLVAVARSTYPTGYFFSKATTGTGGAGTTYTSGLEFFIKGWTNDAGATIVFPGARTDSQSGNSLDWGDSVFDDGRFHIVAIRRINAFMLAMTVDDQAARTTSTGGFDLSQIGKAARIGSVAYGNIRPSADFSIAEILLVHDARTGVVGDGDIAALHAYLKQKYGL